MSAQRSVSPARRLAIPGLALAAGAVALSVVAACGGGSTTPPAAAPTSHAAGAGETSRANQPPPGAFGTIAAISAGSMEVQNPQSGQVTVNFNGSTTFTNTTTASLADVTTGACVTVASASGGNQPATLTARTVVVTPASANGCTAGGAFGGGGGFGGGAGRPSGAPRPSNRPRPSGAPNPANFGRAFGSVTAVTATGFTVHGVARGSTPASDTTVTVNSSTTYTKTATASSADLAVSDCVAAIGPADDTGAVTARTIAISKPGPNGCTTGFGRGGFRGGNGGGNGGNGG